MIFRIKFPTKGVFHIFTPFLGDRFLSVRCLSVCLSVTLVYCGQTVGWIKVKLGTQVYRRPRPWPHCVRWEPASPPPKGHSPLQFLAHISCDQTAEWIKIPLGREVGLGPIKRYCVRWGPSSPSQKGAEPPLNFFLPMSIGAKRLDGSRCHLVRR